MKKLKIVNKSKFYKRLLEIGLYVIIANIYQDISKPILFYIFFSKEHFVINFFKSFLVCFTFKSYPHFYTSFLFFWNNIFSKCLQLLHIIFSNATVLLTSSFCLCASSQLLYIIIIYLVIKVVKSFCIFFWFFIRCIGLFLYTLHQYLLEYHLILCYP